MAGAMVAMSSAAPAAFLYVPPAAPASEEPVDRNSPEAPGQRPLGDETRAAAQPPAGSAAAGETGLSSGVSGRAAHGGHLWRVRSGETLREVLSRWGEREHVEVLFLTDRRYRLHEGRVFEGSFEEAAQALFSALSHLPRPPVGERRFGGRTFAVMHQVSLHQASLHQVRGLGDER